MYDKFFEKYKGYEIQIGHESEPFNVIAKVFNSENQRFKNLEAWGVNWQGALIQVKNKIDQM